MSRRGWLLFGLLSLLWGVPYLMIKVAVTQLDPVFLAWGRTTLAALILLPLALHRRALAPVFRRWRWLLVYTVVEISGPWFLLGHAEQRLTSSTAGLLIAVVPMLAAVMLTVSGDDRLDGRRILGLLIGFAGVTVLVGLDIRVDDLLSVGAVILTAAGYAAGPILITRRLSDLPPLGVVTGSLIGASGLYLPFALWRRPTAPVGAPAIWSVAGLAVLCTAVAFLALFALIAEVGPGRTTLITYVNPAVAILLGVLLLHERATIGMAIGFPLILAGCLLGTARSRRKPEDREPPREIPTLRRAAEDATRATHIAQIQEPQRLAPRPTGPGAGRGLTNH